MAYCKGEQRRSSSEEGHVSVLQVKKGMSVVECSSWRRRGGLRLRHQGFLERLAELGLSSSCQASLAFAMPQDSPASFWARFRASPIILRGSLGYRLSSKLLV